MIQFNLLPSVKLDYVRAKRTKRLTMLGASIAAGASLLILVLLFANVQLQSKHSRDLSNDIKTQSKKLKETQDISSILTVQNQLNSLSALHQGKPEAARLFDYLKQVTPAGISISSVDTDFEATTIKLSGKAPSITAINTYADTLKYTTYKIGDSKDSQNAFSEVVLASIAPAAKDASATYSLSFKFSVDIFSNANKVVLSVPDKVTNSSQVDKPASVFQSQGGQ